MEEMNLYLHTLKKKRGKLNRWAFLIMTPKRNIFTDLPLSFKNCSARGAGVQAGSRGSTAESRFGPPSRRQLCSAALITCPEIWVEKSHPVIPQVKTQQGTKNKPQVKG